jgi:hypothetical protein
MNILQTKHHHPREMKTAAAAGEASDIGWLGACRQGTRRPSN